MRKIELNDKQQERYETIKRLCDRGLDGSRSSKNRATLKLNVCPKTIDRMIKKYKGRGKVAFVHGNSGKKPHNAFPPEVKQQIIEMYLTEFPNANFHHYAEVVQRIFGIKISSQTISNWLGELNVPSPLASRKTRKKMRRREEESRKRKENSQTRANAQNESQRISSAIVSRSCAHPSTSSRKYFGEMVQLDASVFEWIPGQKWILHLAVDDATGIVVGAFFDQQETLRGYYSLMKNMIEDYGIPAMLYTGNRTVFEYKKSGSRSVEKDMPTQFKAAMSFLGVEIKTTSVPQAKGKVERLNGSIQSRLPVELKLAGVETGSIISSRRDCRTINKWCASPFRIFGRK